MQQRCVVIKRVGAVLAAALVMLVVPGVAWGGSPAQSGPTPIPVDQLEVLGVQEIELVAGLNLSAAYLSPDGTQLFYAGGGKLCFYTSVEEPGRCVTWADQMTAPDLETVRWSPDSRSVVFTEEFLRTFNDPDVWVLDAASATLTDLTPDADVKASAVLLGKDQDATLDFDLVPCWSADSTHLFFLRYQAHAGTVTPPAVYRIARDGSDLTLVGALPTLDRFSIYILAAAPDGSGFALNYGASSATIQNGVWLADADLLHTRQIVQEEQAVPFALTYSPDGQYLLADVPYYAVQPADRYQPASSPVRVLAADGSSGYSLLDEAHYVVGAGWSPDGSALAYVVLDPAQPDISGLYLSAGPGEPGRLVLQGRFNVPTERHYAPLTWASNNTILLARSPEQTLAVVQLGQP